MMLDLGAITIRPYGDDDLARLVELADNPLIAANLRDVFPSPYTLKDGRAWLAEVAEAVPTTAFAITLDQQLIGGIGFIPGVDIYRHNAEIGYWLGQPYWGKGYASLAVSGFTRELFVQFGFHRVYAGIFDGNPASVRVLEKCGYSFEGRHRAAILKGGAFLDELKYARLADDEV